MADRHYPEVNMPHCPAEKILKRQKALVTDGSSGIGRAVAVALGQADADVAVNYVRSAHIRRIMAESVRRFSQEAMAGQYLAP